MGYLACVHSPHPLKKGGKRDFIVKEVCPTGGTVLWNSFSSLPLDIHQSPFLDELKSKLKSYDFDGSFM